MVVGFRAQARGGERGALPVPRVVLVELAKVPKSPLSFSPYAVPELSTWSTCPLPYPRHLGCPYLASCNVPTATFTAWNTAQSI